MKWSWRIGQIAGIDVYMHGTFLLLIGFVLISEWSLHRSVTAAVLGVGFILAIFGTVVLHELGHALTARRFGIRTRDITLLPIGGVARLERMPAVPRQELWVALAGPAVNVVIAVACYLLIRLLGSAPPVFSLQPTAGGLMDRFMSVNVVLAVFNLVPAFPMDGGRALRALLAERLDYVRATEVAVSLGQGLALFFGFVGLFSNPMLVFIALFVYMGASGEASAVTLRAALAGIPVSRAMITNFRTLDEADTLGTAVTLALGGLQRDFPVLAGGRLAGILTRDTLMDALARQGGTGRVADAMTREFATADAHEMLDAAFQRLQGCDCPVLPVVQAGRVVGLLTAANVGEYVVVRSALTARRGWRR